MSGVDSFLSMFSFNPPLSVEQILKFEAAKIGEALERDELCKYCLRPESSNPLSQFEAFLTCVDCACSAHPYCLKYGASFVENVRQTKWQCLECKQCSVCLKGSDSMVLCDRCDRGFHKECCMPKLVKRPKGQFICHVCKEAFKEPGDNGQTDIGSSFEASLKKAKKIKKLILNTGRKPKFIKTQKKACQSNFCSIFMLVNCFI